MTFDPFGDFETRGYLRNIANEKDVNIVRRLEHTSFVTGIDDALRHLLARKNIEYADVYNSQNSVRPRLSMGRGGSLANLARYRG